MQHLDYCRLDSNIFTFEDIIPLVTYPRPPDDPVQLTYSPQKTAGGPSASDVIVGTSYTLSLNFDNNVNGSSYMWIKNNNEESPVDTTTINSYTIDNFQSADAGEYYALITNSLAPELTLKTGPVTLTSLTPWNLTINTSGIGTGYQFTVHSPDNELGSFTSGNEEDITVLFRNDDDLKLYLHVDETSGSNPLDITFRVAKDSQTISSVLVNDDVNQPLSQGLFSVDDNKISFLKDKKDKDRIPIYAVLDYGVLMTPDNDEIFDNLQFEGLEDITNYNLKIYNLSQDLVFETSDKNAWWNGINSLTGLLAEKGTYIYLVEADGNIIKGQFIVDY